MRNPVASLLLLVLLASSALAEDVPAKPTRLVTDNAGVLTSHDVTELEQHLARISKHGLAQAIVYIDRTVPPSEDLEAYTLRLANTWGVGSAERNDWVVLFVFVDDRRMRIEVGKGLEEVLTDEAAKGIIDNELRPAFRDGRFAFGLVRALDSIARTLDGGRSGKKLWRTAPGH
jgi:uncharacterized protein